MRYRSENARTPRAQPRSAALWLLAFPGYIILLLSWALVIGGFCALVVGWVFTSGTARTPEQTAIAQGGGAASTDTLLVLLMWLFVILCLVIVYWAMANFSSRLVSWAANFFDTSVWIIKGVGVPLGCGLAAITAMLFRPAFGLQAAGIAGVLCVIALASFGLEYLWGRRLKQF